MLIFEAFILRNIKKAAFYKDRSPEFDCILHSFPFIQDRSLGYASSHKKLLQIPYLGRELSYERLSFYVEIPFYIKQSAQFQKLKLTDTIDIKRKHPNGKYRKR